MSDFSKNLQKSISNCSICKIPLTYFFGEYFLTCPTCDANYCKLCIVISGVCRHIHCKKPRKNPLEIPFCFLCQINFKKTSKIFNLDLVLEKVKENSNQVIFVYLFLKTLQKSQFTIMLNETQRGNNSPLSRSISKFLTKLLPITSTNLTSCLKHIDKIFNIETTNVKITHTKNLSDSVILDYLNIFSNHFKINEM